MLVYVRNTGERIFYIYLKLLSRYVSNFIDFIYNFYRIPFSYNNVAS